MSFGDYAFTTVWRIQAPREAVWEAIHHAERWPEWWRGVESVTEIKTGNSEGIGTQHRFVWKSVIPYRLSFQVETTRAERPRLIEGRASGELEGKGVWHFESEGKWTFVRYDWNVRTCVAWMNLLAPLLRPVFQWNHDLLMRRGEAGLRRLVGRHLLRKQGGRAQNFSQNSL